MIAMVMVLAHMDDFQNKGKGSRKMNREEMLIKINSIFKDAFDDDTLAIEESTCANDIEDWDSLMQITLIAAVEDMFDVKFTLEDALSMKNVGDMMTLIERKQNK